MRDQVRRFGLLLCALLVLSACGQKSLQEETEAPQEDVPTWQEQYDLGVRYLSEGNYEVAIIAFSAAIEIDPKLADAYLKLADVYVAQGDKEAAKGILEKALEVSNEASLIEAELQELSGLKPLEGYPKTERYDYTDSYSVYEYNSFGNPARSTNYSSDGTMQYYFTYEYDFWGKLLYMTRYDADETVNYRETYEYDASDRLLRTVADYNANENNGNIRSMRCQIWEYGADGKVIRNIWEYSTSESVIDYDYSGIDVSISVTEGLENNKRFNGSSHYAMTSPDNHIEVYSIGVGRVNLQLQHPEREAAMDLSLFEWGPDGELINEVKELITVAQIQQ